MKYFISIIDNGTEEIISNETKTDIGRPQIHVTENPEQAALFDSREQANKEAKNIYLYTGLDAFVNLKI